MSKKTVPNATVIPNPARSHIYTAADIDAAIAHQYGLTVEWEPVPEKDGLDHGWSIIRVVTGTQDVQVDNSARLGWAVYCNIEEADGVLTAEAALTAGHALMTAAHLASDLNRAAGAPIGLPETYGGFVRLSFLLDGIWGLTEYDILLLLRAFPSVTTLAELPQQMVMDFFNITAESVAI